MAATPRHRSQARVVAVVLILSTGSSIIVTLVVTSPESIMVPLVIGPDSDLTSDIVTQLGGGPVTTDN